MTVSTHWGLQRATVRPMRSVLRAAVPRTAHRLALASRAPPAFPWPSSRFRPGRLPPAPRAGSRRHHADRRGTVATRHGLLRLRLGRRTPGPRPLSLRGGRRRAGQHPDTGRAGGRPGHARGGAGTPGDAVGLPPRRPARRRCTRSARIPTVRRRYAVGTAGCADRPGEPHVRRRAGAAQQVRRRTTRCPQRHPQRDARRRRAPGAGHGDLPAVPAPSPMASRPRPRRTRRRLLRAGSTVNPATRRHVGVRADPLRRPQAQEDLEAQAVPRRVGVRAPPHQRPVPPAGAVLP